jgi:nucleotide-binding universal stress UspA family protein
MDKQSLKNATLVPIDFSVTSLHALEHAAAIANISTDNSKNVVALLHVIEGDTFDTVYGISAVESGDKIDLAVEGAFTRLQSIIETYKDKFNVNFASIVSGGKPPKTIASVAEEIEAQSIVMGTHGSSGIQALAGSNSSRVILLAPCPVITIREKPFGEGYKNIVLPLDLSVETKQKVAIAATVAQYFKATIHLVSLQKSDEYLAHRLENNLNQVESYLKERELSYTENKLDASEGAFSKETLKFANAKGADLIVIMADEEEAIGDFIFGTTAQQIVNKSTIPVMTVIPTNTLSGWDVLVNP